MAIKLVVVHPFDGFDRGAEITDPKEVARHLEEREQFFVKVSIPDSAPAKSDKS